MDPVYQESRKILPRNLSILLTILLLATIASMLVTKYVFYPDVPIWSITVLSAICAVIIVLCFLMDYTITVYDDRVEIKYLLKKTVIPKEQIIDTKTGELNYIKTYTAWTLKGVKYKTYSAVGEEMGIGLKVTGKRVFYLSTKDPEAIAALLPKEESE